MNNSFKLIITEEAVEFSQESLQIFQDFNICTAFCVKDGEELCSRIRSEEPDVVFMDAFMTRLDAIGVMRSIKKEKLKQPLFIVFSSFHSAVLEREIMNSGADYFMLKPYDVEQLCENISVLMKNKDDNISKEFYYLGRMESTGYCEEFIMPNTDAPAVKIGWKLNTPVRDDLYEYIVS